MDCDPKSRGRRSRRNKKTHKSRREKSEENHGILVKEATEPLHPINAYVEHANTTPMALPAAALDPSVAMKEEFENVEASLIAPQETSSKGVFGYIASILSFGIY
jgi:hypothetical protein